MRNSCLNLWKKRKRSDASLNFRNLFYINSCENFKRAKFAPLKVSIRVKRVFNSRKETPKSVRFRFLPLFIFVSDLEHKERPKLNLQARTVTKADDTSSQSSSIFGGARPVDTAAKERQIEEKLNKIHVSEKPRGERSDSKERGRDDSHERDLSDRTDDDGIDNWRDESIRQDKPRVMKPGFASDRREARKSDSDDMSVLNKENRGRGAGREGHGRGRSPKDKKNKNGPVIPPKYEEPDQPVSCLLISYLLTCWGLDGSGLTTSLP